MKKRILCTICAILILASCLPVLASCGVENVYELGPYSINREEYAYLMCSYKRQILEAVGLDESYINSQISAESPMTYGQYIEGMYREQFEQSVYSLLYSQALFDEYGLSLTQAQYDNIRAVANAMAHAYGGGTEKGFNKAVKQYGFTYDALYSVYEKQTKESVLVSYLYGDNYNKITDAQKDRFYKDNYIHFQILVVNTLYRQTSDGSFINLTEAERNTMLKIETELTKFLVNEDKNYNYEMLPKLLGVDSMENVTYEDLWNHSKINDDKTYPGGIYSITPSAYELTMKTTLTQAMLTQEGDVSALVAKRYFEGNGSLTISGSTESIKKGDSFEYGTVFIKRLPIDDGAWQKTENKEFFGQSFITSTARDVLFKTLSDYEAKSTYTLRVQETIKSEYSLISIPANRIDYDYLHQSSEN